MVFSIFIYETIYYNFGHKNRSKPGQLNKLTTMKDQQNLNVLGLIPASLVYARFIKISKQKDLKIITISTLNTPI